MGGATITTKSDVLMVLPSVIGAACVALGFPYWANLLWLIGNPILIYKNYTQGDMGQTAYFSLCSCLALYGVLTLR